MMWFCQLCNKPFTKESSHKRHVLYCLRSQARPRTRRRACQSCNAAKIKCTFQAPCGPCSAKGFECIYEKPRKTIPAVEHGDTGQNNAGLQTTIVVPDPVIQEDCNTLNVDILNEDELRAANAFLLPDSTSNMEDFCMEPLPTLGYLETCDMSPTITAPPTDEAIPFDTWAWPSAFISPRMGHAAQAPWSAWTTSVAYSPTNSTPNVNEAYPFPQGRCLAPLEHSGPVMQNNRHLVVQALRAYPLMMLRRETLPPFIHPHWHRKTTPALPEPLSNCMSIAQMYAFRSEETRPFLWRTIKAENDRFLAQRFSPEDLLAAIQAQTIYMIMRVVDGASEPADLNRQLMVTYEYLCTAFMKVYGTSFCSSFCEVDTFSPYLSWEDWIFAESRRRTACLFFLICRCVSVDTGHPRCGTLENSSGLPLASPKTLWEAKTREEWESEYSAYRDEQETRMLTMGMLIEAREHSYNPAKSQLLDSWNVRTDNLGSLLNIAAAMV